MKKYFIGACLAIFCHLPGWAHADITSSRTPPGGSNGNVQFNKSSLFSGTSDFIYSTGTKTVLVSSASLTWLSASSGSFSGSLRAGSFIGDGSQLTGLSTSALANTAQVNSTMTYLLGQISSTQAFLATAVSTTGADLAALRTAVSLTTAANYNDLKSTAAAFSSWQSAVNSSTATLTTKVGNIANSTGVWTNGGVKVSSIIFSGAGQSSVVAGATITVTIPGSSGGGDNLGTHVATQTLDMANFAIIRTTSIAVSQNIYIGTVTNPNAMLVVSTGSGNNQPMLVVSTGTTKLLEVTGGSVTLGGTLYLADGSSVTKFNTINANGVYCSTGSTIIKNYGFSSITKVATGITEWTMINAMPSAEYAVQVTAMVKATVSFEECDEDDITTYTKTATLFRIRCGTTLGTETDIFRINVTVPKSP